MFSIVHYYYIALIFLLCQYIFIRWLNAWHCSRTEHWKHLQNQLDEGSEFLSILKQSYIKDKNFIPAENIMHIVSCFCLMIFIFFGWFGKIQVMISHVVPDVSHKFVIQGTLFFLFCYLITKVPYKLCCNIIQNYFIVKHFGKQYSLSFQQFLNSVKRSVSIELLFITIKCLTILPIVGLFSWWWIYAWLMLSIIDAATSWWLPYIKARWKEDYEPLEDGALRKKIIDLLKASHFSVRHIQISKKGLQGLNGASFSGLFASKTITLGKNLIENYPEKQVLAVIAHEIGHGKHNHLLKIQRARFILSGAVWWVLSFFVENTETITSFGFSFHSPAAILMLCVLWSKIFKPFTEAMLLTVKRHHERQADNFAKQLSYGQDLAIYLKNSTKKLGIFPDAHPLFIIFYAAHPTIRNRIRRLTSVD